MKLFFVRLPGEIVRVEFAFPLKANHSQEFEVLVRANKQNALMLMRGSATQYFKDLLGNIRIKPSLVCEVTEKEIEPDGQVIDLRN